MRYTKMAIAAAVLFLGVMSVAAFAPRQPETAPRMAAMPGPALQTFYVPAQHVTQGKDNEQEPWEF